MAVVDPQVGTERRAVALRTGDGRLLVGPDNGLLSLAWERAGGVALAVDVTRSPHRLEPVSATFHGRDVFAPVAAHLAAGAELADAGDPLEPERAGAARAPRAARRRRRARGARAPVRPLRQRRPSTWTTSAWQGSGLTLGASVEVEVGGRRRTRHLRAHVRGRGPGRAARVRGRLSHAGAGGEPRGRRRDARRGAGRRGPPAARMIGTPRVHHRVADSTNERAKELAARRGAARHAGHGRRADRRPRASGPQLAGAARLVGADVGGAPRPARVAPAAPPRWRWPRRCPPSA